MKISVDGKEVLNLNETKKKVIMNDINADEFKADMERRTKHIIMHKYEQCFKRLKDEWEPKLKANGVQSIPLDNDAFATLVMSQPNYKDRKVRDDEEKRKESELRKSV